MSNIYDEFITRTDTFVSQMLEGYDTSDISDKVIHDPIWGSTRYYKWEVQIFDSPLFQRLRDISQVGVALLTYPAARHSRFEHSLGTVAIASKIVENIIARNTDVHVLKEHSSLKITTQHLYKIRLAALVHDIGHCFYSHLSESVYGKLKEFEKLKEYFRKEKQNVKSKPHEMLSYLIINTSSFKKFFLTQVDYPYKDDVISPGREFLEEVGNIIIGCVNSNFDRQGNKIEYSFMTSIINGDFDADKLDYVKRDSYTAGLTLTYDLERFLYKISIFEDVYKVESSNKYIKSYKFVIDMNGITAIEELAFSKLMLYSYIYHHQKVLIADSIVKDIIYGMLISKKVEHPCDFLYYTDTQIDLLAKDEYVLYEQHSNKTIGSLVRLLKKRVLPKKCFEVNRAIMDIECTGKNEDGLLLDKFTKKIHAETDRKNKAEILADYASQSSKFKADGKNKAQMIFGNFIAKFHNMTYKEHIEFRQQFFKKIEKIYKDEGRLVEFDLFDIHFVFPKTVDFTSSGLSQILFKDGTLQPLDAFMNLSDWGQSFNSNKWRGYVFTSWKIDKNIAFKVAQDVLREDGIKFVRPGAFVRGIPNE